MELLLIGLVVYVAVQTVIIPVRLIKGHKVTLAVILYLVAVAAAFFIYTYVIAGVGTIITGGR